MKKTLKTQKMVAVLALILLYIFFSIFGDNFFQYSTLVSIFDSSYYIGFMAIGVTFVIITGGIDLSIGTVCICCSLIGGTLFEKGVPMAAVLIIILVIGTLIGVANGLMVSVMGLPAFIATLGTMMITRGFGSIVTGTATVTFPQGDVAGAWFHNIFKFKTASLPAGIPTGFILLIIMAVLMAVILNKTRPGRYILALGSNKEATRLSGVNVVKWETLAYTFSGTCGNLLRGGVFHAYAGNRKRIRVGCNRGRGNWRNFSFGRKWFYFRYLDRCVYHGSFKDRASVCRTAAALPVVYHRVRPDIRGIRRCIEQKESSVRIKKASVSARQIFR